MQALSDAGGFSRATCVGAAIAGGGNCVSEWATFFPDSVSLRQTSHTISFTICLLVLIGVVALVLVAVELYFQRRSALAFAVIPFRRVLRKDVLLRVLLRPEKSAAVTSRSRRHACCCGRDALLDCSCLCAPACAFAPERMKRNDLSLHVSILFIGVVALAVVVYFSWKLASIDAMLWQLSSVPVVASSGARLWAFSVTCDGSTPLMLLLDIDGQRRAAVSAPQQAGLIARVPSVVFALLVIASFLTPKVLDIVAKDEDPMKDASIATIVERAVERKQGEPARGTDSGDSGAAAEAGEGASTISNGGFDEVTEGELDEALFDLLSREGGCCRHRLRLFSWPLEPLSLIHI